MQYASARNVALRKESVDRNQCVWIPLALPVWVALRKESVDRNMVLLVPELVPWVALRKESVDRNMVLLVPELVPWVALRKESVDRNTACGICGQHVIGSLSARRAWIEMPLVNIRNTLSPSLSARRAWIEMIRRSASQIPTPGRSPQGERG